MIAGLEAKAVLLGSGDPESGGGGSTVKEILAFSALELIAVKIDSVICNNSPAKVPGFYKKIEEHNKKFDDNVRVLTINASRYPAAEGEAVERGVQTLAEATACVQVMEEDEADFYVLAGYMKRIVGALLKKHGINTHPGPLESPLGIPGIDTKGLHGIEPSEKVIAERWPYGGHSVNIVTAEYDEGNVFAFNPTLVRPDDTAQTLFDRTQDIEKARLPYNIEEFAYQLKQGLIH